MSPRGLLAVIRALLVVSMLFVWPGKSRAQTDLALHVVPLPIRSYRLLAMSMDDEGFIWVGSIHRVIHRYDPRTGKVQSIRLPYESNASSCICIGHKVYVLGQSYPRLVVYDRATGKFSEVAYPSSEPDVWYGTEAVAGRYTYLFDRGGGGVIKWDTATDTGAVIRYPYATPLPSAGQYERHDNAIWCRLWQYPPAAGYRPVGLARLDVPSNRFSGWWKFAEDDAGLAPLRDPTTTIFLPFTMEGKIVPFDFKEKRWCRHLDVPRHGELFGFIGGPVKHKRRYYFTLSTYDGDDVGCDGKPYHFLNAILEFDPSSGRFKFLTLDAKSGYHQISYMLSADGEFYATGSNIRQPDGSLNQARRGEIVFWQSQPIEKEE